MLVEAVSMLMIFAVMVFIFLRAKKKNHAIAIMPLLILPFVHTVMSLFGSHMTIDILAIADVVALAVSVCLMGLLSNVFKKGKARFLYLLICGGFTTLICIIFVFNFYKDMLPPLPIN